jgi:hypothetical protein
MNKEDKDWVRAKIFQIIDTPTAELLAEDPRDKLVVKKQQRMDHYGKSAMRREKYSPEAEQMQLFAKYLAEALRKQNDQK